MSDPEAPTAAEIAALMPMQERINVMFANLEHVERTGGPPPRTERIFADEGPLKLSGARP